MDMVLSWSELTWDPTVAETTVRWDLVAGSHFRFLTVWFWNSFSQHCWPKTWSSKYVLEASQFQNKVPITPVKPKQSPKSSEMLDLYCFLFWHLHPWQSSFTLTVFSFSCPFYHREGLFILKVLQTLEHFCFVYETYEIKTLWRSHLMWRLCYVYWVHTGCCVYSSMPLPQVSSNDCCCACSSLLLFNQEFRWPHWMKIIGTLIRPFFLSFFL